eukprot:2382805-Amphidinium_carterae.1
MFECGAKDIDMPLTKGVDNHDFPGQLTVAHLNNLLYVCECLCTSPSSELQTRLSLQTLPMMRGHKDLCHNKHAIAGYISS